MSGNCLQGSRGRHCLSLATGRALDSTYRSRDLTCALRYEQSLPFLEAHVLVLEVEGCLTDSCTSFRTVFGMPVSTCRTWRWHQAARRPRPGAITFFAGAAGLDQFRTSRLETEDGRERVFGERLEKEPRQLSQSHLCRARLTYANEPAASLHYLFVHKPRQRVLL